MYTKSLRPTALLALSGALYLVAASPAFAAPPAGTHFGRFGRINDDGLLTLNVTPTGFSTPVSRTASTLRFAFGERDAAVSSRVTRIDPTEKRLALSGGSPGGPTALRYTLLYPGFSATFGKRMVVRTSGDGRSPVNTTSSSRTALTIRSAGAPPVRFLFARPVRSQFVGGVLTVDALDGAALGEVRVLTPAGIGATGGDGGGWDGRAIPTRTSSTAALAADGKSVTVTETFTGTIAPVPPVLAYALQKGYPARVRGRTVYTGAVTKWGPYAYVAGNRLVYTLPVPPTEERAYLRREGADPKLAALTNDLVGHLGGDWAKNGVDLGYAGMANAQMAWAYLSDAKRQEVSAAWSKYLPRAFDLKPSAGTWKTETEPFTAQSYLWTYFIDGPGEYRYDIEWGNALPLYGLYKYAQYTGDWGFVRARWAAVRRIDRYMALGDDWAWMTVVNADHGFSTGTGDPLDAAFGGAVACLKMARALGDREAERAYALRAARMAVPAVARFWYTDYGRRHGLLGPKAMALGFHETEGYTRSDYGQSPWWPTTLLSGDGVMPEFFHLLATAGRQPFAQSERRYEEAYPRWYVGDHKYPFAASYAGNSVYVTFPHIYGRAAVLNEPTADLTMYLNWAQTNRNNAWIGPNVVAEVASRASGETAPQMVLTEWRPAAYRDGVISRDGRTATLKFSVPQAARWGMSARLAAGWRPVSVTVDGKASPLRFSAGVLTLLPVVRRPGPVTVKVALERR